MKVTEVNVCLLKAVPSLVESPEGEVLEVPAVEVGATATAVARARAVDDVSTVTEFVTGDDVDAALTEDPSQSFNYGSTVAGSVVDEATRHETDQSTPSSTQSPQSPLLLTPPRPSTITTPTRARHPLATRQSPRLHPP